MVLTFSRFTPQLKVMLRPHYSPFFIHKRFMFLLRPIVKRAPHCLTVPLSLLSYLTVFKSKLIYFVFRLKFNSCDLIIFYCFINLDILPYFILGAFFAYNILLLSVLLMFIFIYILTFAVSGVSFIFIVSVLCFNVISILMVPFFKNLKCPFMEPLLRMINTLINNLILINKSFKCLKLLILFAYVCVYSNLNNSLSSQIRNNSLKMIYVISLIFNEKQYSSLILVYNFNISSLLAFNYDCFSP